MKSLDASDIVLCYAGGAGGCMFDIGYMNDYVWYKDRDGNPDWLFDGFLLLQIRDIGDGASEVAFDPGHKNKDGSILPAAAQADWMKLIDYYFEDGQCIDAIDKAVEEAAKILGAPPYKRQVVISIPNPIIYKQPLSKKGGTTYWGILDGKVTDFSKEEDRIAACRWFIDEVLERYGTGKWKHVELAGFYWITEETLDESPLLPEVSAYLHSKGYPLTWRLPDMTDGKIKALMPHGTSRIISSMMQSHMEGLRLPAGRQWKTEWPWKSSLMNVCFRSRNGVTEVTDIAFVTICRLSLIQVSGRNARLHITSPAVQCVI